MTITVFNSDVRDWIKSYNGPLFHAALMDPPYNLESITKRFGKNGSKPAKKGVYKRTSRGFMNHTWDSGIAFDPQFWSDFMGLLCPGAFVFAYGGTRTYHRMATAMEDAGYIIHPAIGWVSSQGFPKATRIDNQIDRKLGAKREQIGDAKTGVASGTHKHAGADNKWGYDDDYYETAPATPQAKVWEGHRYGLMALKPSFEFILVAQKKYSQRPLDDITSCGAGALSIDGARIGARWPSNVVMSHAEGCIKIGTREESYPINRFTDGAKPFGNGAGHEFETEVQTSTIDIYDCVPECPVYRTNQQASKWTNKDMSQVFYTTPPTESEDVTLYVPKVSPKERHAGVNGANIHPTLKPIELNKWLATLLLPPLEYKPRRILVPFSGAGSECIGAMMAGWDEITGIELTPEYIPIAEARIKYWETRMKETDSVGLDSTRGTCDTQNIEKLDSPEHWHDGSFFEILGEE